MAGHDDPHLWSVDQVVDQLCSKHSSVHTTIQIKPILNLATLEQALRQNDIDGESLLSLEDANVKDDLGIASFGQRREIRKIVQHLQKSSSLYQSSVSPKTPKRPLEHDSDEKTQLKAPEPKRRRVQPLLLSTEVETRPETFDPAELPDEWRDFLARHQEESGEEVLRPYNESDQEKELDSGEDGSFMDEIESEDGRVLAPRLHTGEIEAAIDEAIDEFVAAWRIEKFPKKHKTARRRWMQAAQAGTRKPQQNMLQKELDLFKARLTKFRQAVGDASMEYHKRDEVKRNCINLQATVEEITEREYYLEVLADNDPPVKPAEVPKPAKALENLLEGEEVLESSESDDSDSEQADLLDEMSLVSEDDDTRSLSYDPVDDGWRPRIPVVPPPQHQPQMPSPGSTPPEAIPEAMLTTYGPSPTTEAVPTIYPPQAPPHIADPFHGSPLPTPSSLPVFNPSTLPDTTSPAMASEDVIYGVDNNFHGYADHNDDIPGYHDTEMNGIGEEAEEDSDKDIPRLPESRYRTQGQTLDTAIMLGSSPSSTHSMRSDDSIRTPPLNPARVPAARVKLETKTTPQLSYPQIKATRAIRWNEVPTDNPFLALCKIVYRHSRANARDVLEEISRRTIQEIPQGLRSCIAEIEDNEEPDEADTNAAPIIWAFWFIVYANSKGFRSVWEIPACYLDEAYNATNEKAAEFDRLLKSILKYYIATDTAGAKNPDNHEIKQKPTQTNFASYCQQPKSGSVIQTRDSSVSNLWTSDTETDIDEAPSSMPKRKRHVQQSQEALTQQRDDRNRVRELEERRRIMLEKFEASVTTNGERKVLVNAKEPEVMLDQHIARRIKEHQITGIQFIWREIIETPKRQGCLLAHTMGLGKTMQVISFLVTLAQCNASTDSAVKTLVPKPLWSGNTLILCPASLVDNWFDEICLWTPPTSPHLLGPIYRTHGLRQQKLQTVHEWKDSPGTLIMSYETLKSLLSPVKMKDGAELAEVERALLDGPSIVIGDEAHKLKNAKSKINEVAHRFKSTSRIALTGSPLNNHLEEYHTMIDWIAPQYLGTIVQFRSKYSEPIERGLWVDSTRYEKRKSLEKLYVLKRDLAPKIDRKDISAIAADMPQKTEFFITLPLTMLQKEMYALLVKHILHGVGSPSNNVPKATNAQLWAWLAILSLLCNHPAVLMHKLQGEENEYVQQDQGLGNDDEPHLPADINLSQHALAAFLPHFQNMFANIGMLSDQESPALSARAQVTKSLIEKSIAKNDKVLLFSHSIPTLNFLQLMLEQMDVNYLRIDGGTAVDLRQSATKAFNDQDNESMVFLISTRAGGLGLNLQGANRVIIYDFGFNPSWEEQAIGRSYRLGQKKPVYVYRFRARGTFEEAMYNKSIFKTQLFSRVVDQKNVVRQASKKIEDYVFQPPDNILSEDVSGGLGKDELMDQIIKETPDIIRGLLLTETFQREDEDDILSEEEKKAAEEQVRLEQLARTNPVEYTKEMTAKRQHEDRQRHDRPPATPTNIYAGQLHNFSVYNDFRHPASLDTIPLTSTNCGTER